MASVLSPVKSEKTKKRKSMASKVKKVLKTSGNTTKVKKGQKNTNSKGCVYLSNIPHGFYEKEIEGYFGQFGDVTGVYVPRNLKSGRSKGYAFIEFLHPEVAQVAADTMNNYLMFDKLLKASVVPPEKQRPAMFQDKFKHKKYNIKGKRAIKLRNVSVLNNKNPKAKIMKAKESLKKAQKKLQNLGIQYDIKVDETIKDNSAVLTKIKSIDPDTGKTPKKNSQTPKMKRKKSVSETSLVNGVNEVGEEPSPKFAKVVVKGEKVTGSLVKDKSTPVTMKKEPKLIQKKVTPLTVKLKVNTPQSGKKNKTPAVMRLRTDTPQSAKRGSTPQEAKLQKGTPGLLKNKQSPKTSDLTPQSAKRGNTPQKANLQKGTPNLMKNKQSPKISDVTPQSAKRGNTPQEAKLQKGTPGLLKNKPSPKSINVTPQTKIQKGATPQAKVQKNVTPQSKDFSNVQQTPPTSQQPQTPKSKKKNRTPKNKQASTPSSNQEDKQTPQQKQSSQTPQNKANNQKKKDKIETPLMVSLKNPVVEALSGRTPIKVTPKGKNSPKGTPKGLSGNTTPNNKSISKKSPKGTPKSAKKSKSPVIREMIEKPKINKPIVTNLGGKKSTPKKAKLETDV